MHQDLTFIDTHCHIVFKSFEDDLDDVADRWRKAGVKSLIHACVEPSEIESIRSLADRFPELRYAVGVHPLDTTSWNDQTLDTLRAAAKSDSRVLAIGELGLDLFRDSNLNEQLRILRPQLDLSKELNLPIIIHCRDAAEPMLTELKKYNSCERNLRGVMHCWGGSPEEMYQFIELGFYISFSGTVTFPKAENIHTCAQQVPDDRFLIETDCPFLTPVPNRGKRNEPAYVVEVASRLAELRNQSLESIAKLSTANARDLFSLP